MLFLYFHNFIDVVYTIHSTPYNSKLEVAMEMLLVDFKITVRGI